MLDPLQAVQVLEWTGSGHNVCKSGSVDGGANTLGEV